MTNDKANAESLLETSLDLIRRVLIKHETAMLSEFHIQFEARKHELQLIYAERDKALNELTAAQKDADDNYEQGIKRGLQLAATMVNDARFGNNDLRSIRDDLKNVDVKQLLAADGAAKEKGK